VEQKIYSTFLSWPLQYISYPEKGKAVLDEQGFKDFLGKLDHTSYAKKEEIKAKAKLTVLYSLRDWNKYTDVVNGMLKEKLIPMNATGGDWLYGYAQSIHRFGEENKKALKEATAWAKLLATDIPGLNANQKVIYLDLYANLLEQKGDRKLAADIRKSMDKQKLEAAKSGMSFQMLKPITPTK
jgi:hypothetical protein